MDIRSVWVRRFRVPGSGLIAWCFSLYKSALFFIFPITITGAIWVVRVQAAAIATLPLLGFGAIMLGGISALVAARLNLSGLPRPGGFRMINTIFIPLATGMLLVSIGLSMQFKRVKDYLKESLAVAGIKFLIVPLAIGGLAYLIGYGEIENGLPLKVVIVLTTMPVAFSALIPPSIYDLDLDLANACWFFTTACLIWVLPALLIVIEFISS